MMHKEDAIHHQEVYSKTIFGFWVYLLTDFVMFGALFATYIVLKNGTYGGPSARELFNQTLALWQSVVLLLSCVTIGLAITAVHCRHKRLATFFFIITFVLGLVFMGIEWHELSRFIREGNSWKRSAFLSAFFTVIGTHAVHVILGLLWMIVLVIPLWITGVTTTVIRRLTCLKIFWQFINLIWIFIFSIVYLMGAN